MIWSVLFLIFLAPATQITQASSAKNLKFQVYNLTWVDRLRHNLLLKYDKFSRPTQHYNTTTLFVYLNIMQVEVDSKKSILSVNTWVRMTWTDGKLKWKPKDYGGIEEVSLGIHEVWQPDLCLYNSALHGVENYESRHCTARHDGEVTWIAPTVFHSYCKFDFLLWPFETNTCELHIGSWTYNGDEIDVKLHDDGYDLEYYSAGEWKIKNVTAKQKVTIYKCCEEPYIVLIYGIILTRSSELYYHVIFVVSIPIIFIVLTTFWLKPQSEMKLILNICAVIIDILFLLYFGYKIPPRNGNMPLIVRFFSGCLCLTTVSIVISIFVINISTTAYDIPIPRRIRHLLFGKIGKYLGLCEVIYEIENQKLVELQEIRDSHSISLRASDLSISGLDSSNDQQCIISPSKPIVRLEWLLLATAIDRFTFLLFCTIFTIIVIAYIRINNDAFSETFNVVNLPSSWTSNNITNVE